MTKRLMPMLDDPGESPQLRELLETGRSAQVADYDFEQGLRRHLSQVEAGAALPQWAETLQAGGAATTGALGSSLWLWIGVPLLSAAAISAVVLTTASNDDPVVAAVSVQPPMQVAQPVAPETAVPPERGSHAQGSGGGSAESSGPPRASGDQQQRRRVAKRQRPFCGPASRDNARACTRTAAEGDGTGRNGLDHRAGHGNGRHQSRTFASSGACAEGRGSRGASSGAARADAQAAHAADGRGSPRTRDGHAGDDAARAVHRPRPRIEPRAAGRESSSRAACSRRSGSSCCCSRWSGSAAWTRPSVWRAPISRVIRTVPSATASADRSPLGGLIAEPWLRAVSRRRARPT